MSPDLQKRIIDTLPRITGWCWEEKALTMAGLICDLKPQVVVEIGVWAGKSLIPMAMALKENGSGIAHGFDPWLAIESLKGDHEPESSEWWAKQDHEMVYRMFVGMAMELNLTDQMYWYRMTGEAAQKHFDHVDFLHIDGNHSEAKSVADIELWWPKLSSGGMLVFDDVNWETTKKAVLLLEKLGKVIRCEIVPEGSYGIYQKP